MPRSLSPATVSHALYPVPEHLKTALLLELIRHAGGGSVLVFTRTKHRAKRLAQKIQAAGRPPANSCSTPDR
jgi:ATP-dependent RNA helicase RhlE